MSDILLFEKIDQLVDDCTDAHGNWNDVLRRSGVVLESTPAPRRSYRFANRRALVWAFVLASLLVILFATPAFGLLRDWIGRKDVRFNGKTAPYLVKRDFADQSIGIPKNMNPQVIASQSRRVASFPLFGKEAVVYVAPTRKGGFCVTFGKMTGTCARSRPKASDYPRETGSLNPHLLSVISGMSRVPGTRAQFHAGLYGVVFANNAASLRVEYEDHTSVQIPFVFVSKPIDAGFFIWGRPSGHRRVGKRPLAVSARDSHGKLISRVLVLSTSIPRPSKAPSAVPPKLPWRSSPVPKPPLQRGQADGVSFVAGKNGVVTIDISHVSARVRTLIGKNGFWSCFSFFGPYHEIDPVGVGTSIPATRARATLSIDGIPTPFDGCQLEGMYGHRWPDRLHSHSVVEVAFTARAKKYFADHAAAKDLAGFLRRIREIRYLSDDALQAVLSRRFGTTIKHLPSTTSSLPPERIGYFDSAGGATFVEYSTTGRRFYVTIEKGKISSENVRGLTYLH